MTKVLVESYGVGSNSGNGTVLAYVEVLEGDRKGDSFPMWCFKPVEVGTVVIASEFKLDELEEEYLTFK